MPDYHPQERASFIVVIISAITFALNTTFISHSPLVSMLSLVFVLLLGLAVMGGVMGLFLLSVGLRADKVPHVFAYIRASIVIIVIGEAYIHITAPVFNHALMAGLALSLALIVVTQVFNALVSRSFARSVTLPWKPTKYDWRWIAMEAMLFIAFTVASHFVYLFCTQH